MSRQCSMSMEFHIDSSSNADKKCRVTVTIDTEGMGTGMVNMLAKNMAYDFYSALAEDTDTADDTDAADDGGLGDLGHEVFESGFVGGDPDDLRDAPFIFGNEKTECRHHNFDGFTEDGEDYAENI